jgi:hypothetical protein
MEKERVEKERMDTTVPATDLCRATAPALVEANEEDTK